MESTNAADALLAAVSKALLDDDSDEFEDAPSCIPPTVTTNHTNHINHTNHTDSDDDDEDDDEDEYVEDDDDDDGDKVGKERKRVLTKERRFADPLTTFQHRLDQCTKQLDFLNNEMGFKDIGVCRAANNIVFKLCLVCAQRCENGEHFDGVDPLAGFYGDVGNASLWTILALQQAKADSPGGYKVGDSAAANLWKLDTIHEMLLRFAKSKSFTVSTVGTDASDDFASSFTKRAKRNVRVDNLGDKYRLRKKISLFARLYRMTHEGKEIYGNVRYGEPPDVFRVENPGSGLRHQGVAAAMDARWASRVQSAQQRRRATGFGVMSPCAPSPTFSAISTCSSALPPSPSLPSLPSFQSAVSSAAMAAVAAATSPASPCEGMSYSTFLSAMFSDSPKPSPSRRPRRTAEERYADQFERELQREERKTARVRKRFREDELRAAEKQKREAAAATAKAQKQAEKDAEKEAARAKAQDDAEDNELMRRILLENRKRDYEERRAKEEEERQAERERAKESKERAKESKVRAKADAKAAAEAVKEAHRVQKSKEVKEKLSEHKHEQLEKANLLYCDKVLGALRNDKEVSLRLPLGIHPMTGEVRVEQSGHVATTWDIIQRSEDDGTRNFFRNPAPIVGLKLRGMEGRARLTRA